MKNYVLVAFSMASLFGCAGTRPGSNREPRVDVTIVNRSAHMLENALARFGKYECGFGYVVVSGNKGWVGFPHPITAGARLEWDQNGKHCAENVDLKKIYEPNREGELIFTVYEGRVDVTFQVVDFDHL